MLKGDLTRLGGSTVEAVTEAFPGVALWEKFDDDCKTAEAARDPLIEAAKSERDLVVNRLPHCAFARAYQSGGGGSMRPKGEGSAGHVRGGLSAGRKRAEEGARHARKSSPAII
jgi:hypothetical protein